MVKLGALWTGKTKDGAPMLSGSINQDCRILILKNGFKKEAKHPDYIVYLVPSEEKGKGKGKPEPEAEEDIPF